MGPDSAVGRVDGHSCDHRRSLPEIVHNGGVASPEIKPDLDRPLPPYVRRIKGSGATAVLGAAMIAVGEILEPDKTSVEIEQTDGERHDPDQFDLNFGDLPSLD